MQNSQSKFPEQRAMFSARVEEVHDLVLGAKNFN
jgi:hypothetical protein